MDLFFIIIGIIFLMIILGIFLTLVFSIRKKDRKFEEPNYQAFFYNENKLFTTGNCVYNY